MGKTSLALYAGGDCTMMADSVRESWSPGRTSKSPGVMAFIHWNFCLRSSEFDFDWGLRDEALRLGELLSPRVLFDPDSVIAQLTNQVRILAPNGGEIRLTTSTAAIDLSELHSNNTFCPVYPVFPY